MDAAAQLALMVKAKTVFGAPDTFLSFPVSPLPYTKRQLDFYAQSNAAELAESLQHLHAFSTLVNLVPSGEAWVPAEARYLWDAYRAVLDGDFADSHRTADEEADYQRAVAYLRRTHPDGTWEDSDAVKSYKQHKDASIVAQQQFAAARATAEASADEEVRRRWREAGEPEQRAALAALEQVWILEGHKHEVESAQARAMNLSARSPIKAWEEWSGRFNKDIDSLTDTTAAAQVFPSTFAPTNALEEGAWVPFTLTEDEIRSLNADAPADLRSRLDADGVSSLKSLAFEFSSATIVRPWFAPEAFRARFWRLPDGAAISDGGSPGTGLCPAYVTAAVFVRRVKEERKPDAPAAPMLKFRFAKDIEAVRDHRSSSTARLAMLAAARPARRRVLPLRRAAAVRAPLGGLMVADLAVARPAPVPPPARPVVDVRHLAVLRAGGFTRVLPASPPASTPAVSDDIFVMAFICRKVGKCPDPDPALQW